MPMLHLQLLLHQHYISTTLKLKLVAATDICKVQPSVTICCTCRLICTATAPGARCCTVLTARQSLIKCT
ncbi:hypothetical protein A2U01_0021852 [Trifolium medium]|uniref:Uncharacterized protein n=1 Tax=Trifolium medium TaxID=97028 RepID=A0A392NNM3_9FABA|nr:hypothetical protein [Trifolium medium]